LVLRRIIGGLLAAAVIAASAICAQAQQPAVSAPNGKLEFDAGALNLPSSFAGRVAGTLTLPVGDTFGIQADFSAASVSGFTGSTALHFFTRDPQRYLVGGTLGAVWTPGTAIIAAGPEAELYMDMWTLEAWGGVALVQPKSGANHAGVFGMADIAYYPASNFRVSAGVSLLDGYSALHLGTEYLFTEGTIPLAFTGEARLGQDGSILATIGLRAYFGAPHKSLIDRHRQDDPWDRGGSLLTAVAGYGGGGSVPVTPSNTSDPSDNHGCTVPYEWNGTACANPFPSSE
jgi:hypothetical protein